MRRAPSSAVKRPMATYTSSQRPLPSLKPSSTESQNEPPRSTAGKQSSLFYDNVLAGRSHAAAGGVSMEKRPFGNTGLQVSILGFGGAEIGFRGTTRDQVETLLN